MKTKFNEEVATLYREISAFSQKPLEIASPLESDETATTRDRFITCCNGCASA